MHDRFATRLLLLTIALVAVILAFEAGPALRARLVPVDVEPRLVTPRGDLASDERATIEVFEATKDSVVSISTRERVVDYWTRNAYDVPRGTGSGFVWDAAGHVVTNAHVIRGATSATVRLADGRAVRARLVGADPTHDLAVLRIDAEGEALAPLAIGTSQDLQVGQKVFAIGNPFGLDWTLTTGVISALERELPAEEGGTLRGLIQTDAAINPGNSGGPLIDSAGRLVGVNTAIYSPSGSSAGIGFAVPVDAVNRVVPQILGSGRYRPPVLGVATDPRADDLLARSGVEGVLVLSVEPGTPAERAGLRPAQIHPDGRILAGDIIVGLDGDRVVDTEELRAALDRRRAGETVRLGVLRDGARSELSVTLDEAG
ncbi:S1C family serine protease [Acuticoccus sp.]|uniref:S1C family serine protease n=1 Tax=Acuticoccus sp. TaxID=1904378 RepID=UPI003B5257FE